MENGLQRLVFCAGMRIARIAVAIVLLISIALQGGCASLQDCKYSALNEYRANAAWLMSHANTKGASFPKEFGRGWRQGYFDVSMGRCGNVPPVPPRRYWSAHYNNCCGAQAIQDWYVGYQTGVIAAERKGAGNWHRLPALGDYCEPATDAMPWSSGQPISPEAEPLPSPHAKASPNPASEQQAALAFTPGTNSESTVPQGAIASGLEPAVDTLSATPSIARLPPVDDSQFPHASYADNGFEVLDMAALPTERR
jgi:hypothetical protein